MQARSNAEWLDDLRDAGRREAALAELRPLLLNGLRRGLVDYVNTAGPEFAALAEDFVQEALLKILDNLESFRGESQFTTWAHKVAVRVALSELRHKQWQDRSLDALLSAETVVTFQPADAAPTPDLSAEQRDLAAVLHRLIEETLTEKQRTALQLVPIGQMPIAEAAERLGMTRNALYKLLHDARLRLKQRLAEEGLTPDDLLDAFGQ